jgi:hypothetical protein
MFTGNEDMEETALRGQGWSISAIARHLGRDRRMIRDDLNGTRVVGKRRWAEPNGFEPFVAYLRERLVIRLGRRRLISRPALDHIVQYCRRLNQV